MKPDSFVVYAGTIHIASYFCTISIVPESEVDVFSSNAFYEDISTIVWRQVTQALLSRASNYTIEINAKWMTWNASCHSMRKNVCSNSKTENRLWNHWSFRSRGIYVSERFALASSHWHYLITFESVNYNYNNFPLSSLAPTANRSPVTIRVC